MADERMGRRRFMKRAGMGWEVSVGFVDRAWGNKISGLAELTGCVPSPTLSG